MITSRLYMIHGQNVNTVPLPISAISDRIWRSKYLGVDYSPSQLSRTSVVSRASLLQSEFNFGQQGG